MPTSGLHSLQDRLDPAYSGTYVTVKWRQFKGKQYTTEAENWNVIENHHEPAVTKKDYKAVQAILQKKNHKKYIWGRKSSQEAIQLRFLLAES